MKYLACLLCFYLVYFSSCNNQSENDNININDISGPLIPVIDLDQHLREDKLDLYFEFNFQETENSYINLYQKLNEEEYSLLDKVSFPTLNGSSEQEVHLKNDIITYIGKTNNEIVEIFLFKRNQNSLLLLSSDNNDHLNKTKEIKRIANADSIALLALYKATNGEKWTNKWDLSKPVAEWYGVKLGENDSVYYLHTLELANNNLVGKLPGELIALKGISFYGLNLIGNKLKCNFEIDNYENNLNLKFSMDYFDTEPGNEDNHIAFVQVKDGVKVYKTNSSGEVGEEIGQLGHNQKVKTIDKFRYLSPQGSVRIENYIGNYIPIHFGEDTALVFSAYLSDIPFFLEKENMRSVYSYSLQTREHEYVEGSVNTTISQFSKNIVTIDSDGFASASGHITFDKKHHSIQEVYLYANNKFGFIFSKYFGEKFPSEELNDTKSKNEGLFKKIVNLDKDGNISRIYLLREEGVAEDWELVVEGNKITVSSGAYD